MTQYDYSFKKFIEPFGLTDTDFEVLINQCEFVQIKKREILIHEGIKQDIIYFICKGIVRNFVLSQSGEIKTYSFRMENMLVTGYGLHNFRNEFKSLVSVECLEHCEFIKIPLTALRLMEKNSKDAQKIARHIAELHIVDLVNFIISTDTKSLIERYDDLDKIFPNIHQRVSQHIIAAYLRISRVHLSRIKKARLNM